MSACGVRRAKAALSSGCKPDPAIAPAGSNRRDLSTPASLRALWARTPVGLGTTCRGSSLITPWGFPCFARFPCVHAAATTPAQRLNVSLRSFHPDVSVFPIGLSGRPAHCPFRGLLGVHSRCGLHTRAVTNLRHANRRLQPLRYLHDCSDCFRLERLPGRACTHWKAPPLHGAHP
jgi:hypothetical protein